VKPIDTMDGALLLADMWKDRVHPWLAEDGTVSPFSTQFPGLAPGRKFRLKLPV
jgi:hypothetical protein